MVMVVAMMMLTTAVPVSVTGNTIVSTTIVTTAQQ